MKDSERNKNSLIDEFYNESQEKISPNTVHCEADLEFKSVLNSTAKKMDILNEYFENVLFVKIVLKENWLFCHIEIINMKIT